VVAGSGNRRAADRPAVPGFITWRAAIHEGGVPDDGPEDKLTAVYLRRI
jgi:hypothetical protein